MAANVMFTVADTFDLETLATRLAESFKVKGYTINVINMKDAYAIIFDKKTGGINNLLGLGVRIRATITKMNNTVIISFSDAEWLGKIVGLVVGWFLCMVPFITAIIGTIQQLSLPKAIGDEAILIASTL